MKQHSFFLYVLGFLMLGGALASAGSTTLTTYYPAPNGNYNELSSNYIGVGVAITSPPAGVVDIASSYINQGNCGTESAACPASPGKGYGLLLDSDYTNGDYRYRFLSTDRGNNLSLYVQEAIGANSFSNLARFGFNQYDSNTFAVFGNEYVGGSVGIGINTPLAQLHLYNATNGGDLGIGQQNDSTPYMRLGMDTGWDQYIANNAYWTGSQYNYVNTGGYGGVASAIHQVSGMISFDTASGGTNPITWNNRMVISNNGNVGIGLGGAVPGYTLQINVPAQGPNGIYVTSSAAGGDIGIFPNAGPGGANPIASAGDTQIIYTSSSGIGTGALDIAPWSAALSGIHMDQNGNVGIGIGNPQVPLQVQSNQSPYYTQLGNGPYGLYTNGSILIGSAPPSTTNTYIDSTGDITAAGTITANSSVTASAFYYSDRRLKKNILPLIGALEKLEHLNGVTFTWKKSGIKDIGVIAQNVEKVLPEIVKTGPDGMKTVEYGNLAALFIEAIKEQQKEIKEQQKEIDELEKKIGRNK